MPKRPTEGFESREVVSCLMSILNLSASGIRLRMVEESLAPGVISRVQSGCIVTFKKKKKQKLIPPTWLVSGGQTMGHMAKGAHSASGKMILVIVGMLRLPVHV